MTKEIITLGPQFSYSHNLVQKMYKDYSIELVDSIREVFDGLDKFKTGVVPVENMLNGSVRETFLELQRRDIHIFGGFDYTLNHVLASKSKDFTTVMSHPQALVQCGDFIHSLKQKGITIIKTSSTSKAMKLASQDKNIAAIGSKAAAKYYNLRIIKEKISDKQNNITRFVEIGLKEYNEKGAQTSLIIIPRKDKVGLLFEILAVFKIKNLNLTKIESMPTGEKMNDYIFYVDVEGSLNQGEMQDALEFLQTFVDVKVFGSYNIIQV